MIFKKRQKGASAIALIMVLAIMGYAVFVGLQYIPQMIESQTVDSILESIQKNHAKTPVQNFSEIQNSIDRQLNINQMNDMKDKFHVSQYRGDYTIKVTYERELNLGYTRKTVPYEKTLVLD